MTRVTRACRRRLKYALIFVLMVSTFFAVLRHFRVVCINWDAQTMLRQVCTHHENGDALGNLCARLCNSQSSSAHKCISSHAGKAVVFEAVIDNNVVVMVKGQSLKPREDENLAQVYAVDERSNLRKYPDFEQFRHMVVSYIEDNYGIKTQNTKSDRDQFFARFWTAHFDGSSAFSIAGMENIFDLVQSNEYVLAKLYEDHALFPSILGTCGSFYVTERLDPLFDVYQNTLDGFVADVRLSLKLLDLLDELEMVFDEPLVLCDVKEDHFGISQRDQRIKILDADNAFLQSIVEREIGSQSFCRSHSDCSFFDCQGRCDLLQNTCFSAVMNNNLQLLCSKILAPRLSKSAHAHFDLKQTLKQCAGSLASSDVGQTDGAVKANAKIKTELYKQLREVVLMAESFRNDEI